MVGMPTPANFALVETPYQRLFALQPLIFIKPAVMAQYAALATAVLVVLL